MMVPIPEYDNPDIVKERARCTFPIKELTNLFYLDKSIVERKHYFESIIAADEKLHHKDYAFMDRDEAYSQAIDKSCHVVKTMMDLDFYGTNFVDTFLYLNESCPNEARPLALNHTMFIPTLSGQGSAEQIDTWFERANNDKILGTYAQTELGHGTFIRGLETTATYDPTTEEFIIHSPTLSSVKFWPGGLGKTSNMAIVAAQLIVRGVNHGVHFFIVQLRSFTDHTPLPGITLGDIGPKFGYQTMDNGFLRLENVRIPRSDMLSKYSQVSPDGTYTRRENSGKVSYFTMTLVRSLLTLEQSRGLAKAATIAVRYSAIRRQGEINSGQGEVQILDYQTQQYKLFTQIAASYALGISSLTLYSYYLKISAQVTSGELEELPQLHALSSCLKAIVTTQVRLGMESCRLACGGHGYSRASGIPAVYEYLVPACTYEGENTVMLLQTARYLMKCMASIARRAPVASSVHYLDERVFGLCPFTFPLQTSQLVQVYRLRAAYLNREAFKRLSALQGEGLTSEEAFNMNGVLLTQAAWAHGLYSIVRTFATVCELHDPLAAQTSSEGGDGAQPNTLGRDLSPSTREVLGQLCQLFALYNLDEDFSGFEMFVTAADHQRLRGEMYSLLGKIRPNAVAVADSFDFSDFSLQSALGCKDGWVYERLFNYAQQSTLNTQEVHRSYERTLGPFLKRPLSKETLSKL